MLKFGRKYIYLHICSVIISNIKGCSEEPANLLWRNDRLTKPKVSTYRGHFKHEHKLGITYQLRVAWKYTSPVQSPALSILNDRKKMPNMNSFFFYDIHIAFLGKWTKIILLKDTFYWGSVFKEYRMRIR